jgi:outer membrane translocation and assembly module TamA
VTNLRGFSYNKLSGFNYLLFNAELRLPLVKYFYRGPIASNFLKNLQFVAFTDIGTAWNQQSPFSRQNDLNTEVKQTESGPFRATVVNFKNPFLSGYGLGARTLLLGYYVKFDAAWGVENYVVSPVRFYLTLGYDF